MAVRRSNLIGDILLRENKLSKEDLERGLELQSDSNKTLGDILIKDRIRISKPKEIFRPDIYPEDNAAS